MPETIHGLRDLGRKLDRLEDRLRGKTLRSAAFQSMLPAMHEARASAPVASPPYGPYAGRSAPTDPYPRKTYKGRYVLPGFTSRSIVRKSYVSRDKRAVTVRLGVRKEAFYALSFIELGTSRFAARPWLEPAFRRSQGRVLERFRARARELIQQAIR